MDSRWQRLREHDTEKDLEELRRLTIAERGDRLAAACAMVEAVLAGRSDAGSVLERQEPRPASAEAWWGELLRRGRKLRHADSR